MSSQKLTIDRFYYIMFFMERREIPNPAFWAITKRHGAQLIEPDTELHQTIVENLDAVPTHGIIGVGDILIASESSRVIDPEPMGIERKVISNYRPEPEPVGHNRLRRLFRR